MDQKKQMNFLGLPKAHVTRFTVLKVQAQNSANIKKKRGSANLMVIDRVHNSLEYVSSSIVVGTLALKCWPILMSMTNSLSLQFWQASLMKTQFNLKV